MKKNIVILIFLIISCEKQLKKCNYMNKELIHLLYTKIDSIDFEEHREEMILLDVDNDKIMKCIITEYKSDRNLQNKINQLDESKKKFYSYAFDRVKEDYKKYNYIDGPYFDYLIQKRDSNVLNIMLNIINDDKIEKEQKKEILHNISKYNYFRINDPDGYTNLRKEKSTQSEVIQIINSGESIEVLDNSDEWFEVKTKDGNIGFVHKSRVKTE
ncbi:SH3 domain-containing protein [Ornithobacterium rhinotracheale]|uniref:SH3 domain-containing protein n=2 Tax=Ornithobacterium rhinotracheale TaxID=28251 RepID=A0A3R5URX8_ORNRH|nr:SH3 domain-containing protein [Ornithobacterium rhinotracheale]